jgi:hypothetical protein
VSRIVARRSRHSLEGLPPLTSDEELIAWSQSLVRASDDIVVGIGEPPPAPVAPPRRREPLRAADRASRDVAARTDSVITVEEIFDEIRERVNWRT